MLPKLFDLPFAIDPMNLHGKNPSILTSDYKGVTVPNRCGRVLIVSTMGEVVFPEKSSTFEIDPAESVMVEFDQLPDSVDGFNPR
jgi:hypothetical protein